MVWRMSLLFDRNIELRRRYANLADQFIDFPMQRMVKEPLVCVAEIYQQFDIPLTEPMREKMEDFMKVRDLSSRTPHIYDPHDYGLELAQLWPRFQEYRDFYGIAS